MHKLILLFIFLIINPALSFAQGEHTPYAGQEKREIKALSSEDINGYLTGHGMGFAKAAELEGGLSIDRTRCNYQLSCLAWFKKARSMEFFLSFFLNSFFFSKTSAR